MRETGGVGLEERGTRHGHQTHLHHGRRRLESRQGLTSAAIGMILDGGLKVSMQKLDRINVDPAR